MSFLNTLFKTIKTTADITSTSLDYIRKGLEDVNKSINQEIQFQELMSDAKVAYNFIVESINTADELSDLDLKVSKYPSDLINEVRKLSSDSATKDFGLENQKNGLLCTDPLPLIRCYKLKLISYTNTTWLSLNNYMRVFAKNVLGLLSMRDA